MPWIHLHVGQKGNAYACCVANIPFGNINEQSFEEVWNGEPIKAIREKFAKGESDNRCKVCQKVEQAGGKSIRLETFEKYEKTDLSSGPFYFDIRFSNVCNFKCRTCWHGASSKWFEDAKALKRSLTESAIIKNVDDFDDFISKFGDKLLNSKEIYFAGGEPLVTEEHYLLLDYLLEHNRTDILLRYNTNFSILKFKGRDILQYWERFSNVEVMASLDEIEEKGEYVRSGFDWNQFLDNRRKLDTLNNVKFKVAPTISVFNIGSLVEMYHRLVDKAIIEPDDFYINLLERPYYYNVRSLSEEEKIVVSKKLDLEGLSSQVVSQFQEVKGFMNSEDLSNHRKAFEKETNLLDDLRGEKYSAFY